MNGRGLLGNVRIDKLDENEIKVIAYCYPRDMDNKEKVRALLKCIDSDITEIDPPDCAPPNKKIPCFSFMVEMDKAKYILNKLNEIFFAKLLEL
jgi:hypothetical protein